MVTHVDSWNVLAETQVMNLGIQFYLQNIKEKHSPTEFDFNSEKSPTLYPQ